MFIPIQRNLPVVVKPRGVAGNDDVVCLFCHIVFTCVHQTIDFTFALFLIILQRQKKTGLRHHVTK